MRVNNVKSTNLNKLEYDLSYECTILQSKPSMFTLKLVIKKINNSNEFEINIPKCYRYLYLKYLALLRKNNLKIDEVITILTPNITPEGPMYTFECKRIESIK